MTRKINLILGGVFALGMGLLTMFGAGGVGPNAPCGSECHWTGPEHCPYYKPFRYCDYYCDPGGCLSGWTCVASC